MHTHACTHTRAHTHTLYFASLLISYLLLIVNILTCSFLSLEKFKISTNLQKYIVASQQDKNLAWKSTWGFTCQMTIWTSNSALSQFPCFSLPTQVWTEWVLSLVSSMVWPKEYPSSRWKGVRVTLHVVGVRFTTGMIFLSRIIHCSSGLVMETSLGP